MLIIINVDTETEMFVITDANTDTENKFTDTNMKNLDTDTIYFNKCGSGHKKLRVCVVKNLNCISA